MKVLTPFLASAVMLCLLQGVQAFGLSDTKEQARQTAATANDNAVTLEGRREALEKLEEAVRLYMSAGETVEAARVLNRVGRLQLILYAPQDVLTSHKKALSLLEHSPNIEVEIDNLNGLAAAYFYLEDTDGANEALRKAFLLSDQSKYSAGRAEALLTLSELQNLQNHETALQTAQEALTLWQTVGDQHGVARTYAHLGRCYLAQNILPKATENYEKALEVWRSLNDVPQQAAVLVNLGFIEYRKAEWQSSISLLIQAQGLVDAQAEPKIMGQIAAGLAEAFNQNGLPENGIVQYQRALDYYRQSQDARGITHALWGLGRTFYLSGNHQEALNYLQQSLVGVKQDSLDAGASYEYIGRVYIATGEYAVALQYLQSALGIYDRAVNPREAAQVRGLMGQIHQLSGNLERGRQEYLKALTVFREISDRVNQAAVYYALGRLEMNSGNYDAAETYLGDSIAATENIRRTPTSSDLTTAFSASVHERYEAYIACLMLKHHANPAQGFNVRAFETSELARARSLAELLRATGTNLMRDPQLAAQEKALRQSLRLKENSKVALLSEPYSKEALDSLEKELLSLEAQYKLVIESIRERYPSYEQITRPVAWGLRQIQEQIVADDGTVLLEYMLGADRSYVWAITRTEIQSYELPERAQINKAAQKVYKLLATTEAKTTQEELRQAIEELAQMVIVPVGVKMQKPRVIVVADGALHYIPFQILSDSSTNDQPLVATTEVINAPSASILGQLRQETAQQQPRTKVLAAFGDPVFAANYAESKNASGATALAMSQNSAWQGVLRDIELNGDRFDPSVIRPLFYAKRELANLRTVAGGESFFATEFSATRDDLLKTDLSQYSILHFATHGFLDPKRPENSGFVLSTVDRQGQELNGFIGLQDIYQLRAPVDLVVLSACQTGLGKDVRGEGLIGLTRGFMYAGAKSVVASLWKVDDEATAELMKQFYENMLQKGMTPAAALRAAQNSIRQKPEWSSPYYWAAFTLQGEYRNVIKPGPHSRNYLRSIAVVMLLITLLVSLGWYSRRLANRKVIRP